MWGAQGCGVRRDMGSTPSPLPPRFPLRPHLPLYIVHIYSSFVLGVVLPAPRQGVVLAPRVLGIHTRYVFWVAIHFRYDIVRVLGIHARYVLGSHTLLP